MNINIDEIKNQFQVGYQFAVEQGGKLLDHTVKYLKQGLELARQDARVAALTVAVANIVILNVALLITILANKILVRLWGPEEDWSERAILTHSIVTVISVASLVLGCNIALYQRLKSPLSPMVTGAISIASFASYALFYAWRASDKRPVAQ